MASAQQPPRDPLTAAADSLGLAVAAIDKHFLIRLRERNTPGSIIPGAPKNKALALLEYKPTLAHLARFHKLQRLRDSLEKFAEIYRDLRARKSEASLKPQVDSFASQSQSLASQVAEMWSTKKAALDATYCLQYVKALEFKISELHKLCLKLLDSCFDLLKAAKSQSTSRLPINQELVMEIAESMPEKYTVEED